MATTRISGIMSGFDTETMIKDLMKAENTRLNKVKQNRQYVLWQQEGYREIINKLRTFQSNRFDVLKNSQNLKSPSSFAKFSYSVTSGGTASTSVSVTANADVKSKATTIESITTLASKDTWTGDVANIRGIKTAPLNLNDIKTALTDSGTGVMKDFEITLAVGSVAKKITISTAEMNGFADVDAFSQALKDKITSAFGSDYSNVLSFSGGELKFDKAGSEVKLLTYSTNTQSMTALGFSSNQSSYAFNTKTVNELFGFAGGSISINGKSIAIDSTDTISKMMQKVNASDANVLMTYDSLSDKFKMASKTEGTANNIVIENGSSAEQLFQKVFNVADLIDASGNVLETGAFDRTEGKNAVLSINGVSITQGNNTFTVDGMTYTLKATSNTPINISVQTDTAAIVDNIKSFVTEYNEIVDFITGKLSEKRDYDYEPLTDEEREALSDEEIEKWESKAKNGMMKGASELNTMLTDLRNAIIEPIDGVGISMSQIGISSTGYSDRGKLTIDETKLKSAIDNNYEDVVSLFTKESTKTYTDNANRDTRDKENGIASRFDDILKDYTRTTRDTNGNKGVLINKAGIENDSSQFSNDFQKRITGFDDRVADLMEFLADREDYYFRMFSSMESALSKMESQSASLLSQLGSN